MRSSRKAALMPRPLEVPTRSGISGAGSLSLRCSSRAASRARTETDGCRNLNPQIRGDDEADKTHGSPCEIGPKGHTRHGASAWVAGATEGEVRQVIGLDAATRQLMYMNSHHFFVLDVCELSVSCVDKLFTQKGRKCQRTALRPPASIHWRAG